MTLLYPLLVKFYLSNCYVTNTLTMNEAPRDSLVERARGVIIL